MLLETHDPAEAVDKDGVGEKRSDTLRTRWSDFCGDSFDTPS